MSENNYYDQIVIGLGAMGSASLYYLAQSGARVLGIERFQSPHAYGSSHGSTRVIREAYYEDPRYVPLLKKAYTLWQDLEAKTGQKLLQETGGLMIGSTESQLFQGALHSARSHDLPHQILNSTEINQNYPAFAMPPHFQAVKEPRAGYLYSEKCIANYLAQAQNLGAQIQNQTQVLGWKKTTTGYEVETSAGVFYGQRLIISAGAWLPRLMPQLQLPLTITRQVLYWFETQNPEHFALGAFPIFIIEESPELCFYGFPDEGEGFKVALHIPGSPLDPETLSQEKAQPKEINFIQTLIQRYFPLATGPLKTSAVCMYTLTPDQHFLIDQAPDDEDILILSPCSGHGFKFSAVIGALAADWAQDRPWSEDLSLFKLGRFWPFKAAPRN